MSSEPLHVAIVGGGLCGLALAIALEKRTISYTIYESHASFTEIGAGINLGPNTIQAFDLIDPAISTKIFELATRNAPGRENIWMTLRLAAPTENFSDCHLLTEINAPPTGNMTVSRNEILQLLAGSIQSKNAKFNKKLSSIDQSESGVTLNFEDGTQDRASVAIGCDGAHSIVRRQMLGANNPASKPKYTEAGGYRAVFPIQLHEEIMGSHQAHSSQLLVGPNAYIIMYPIDGGKNANIGLWPYKPGEWSYESWIVPNSRDEMLKDFESYGSTVKKVMANMNDETAFWATFHYADKPDSYHKGRVCIIGDAAHSMAPHQGQGAAQAMEDACVMAEVLRNIDANAPADALALQIEAAFSGHELVRRPRFEKALETSHEAFNFWTTLWRPDLTEVDLAEFSEKARERFKWLWSPDIPGQSRRATAEMEKILQRQNGNSIPTDSM